MVGGGIVIQMCGRTDGCIIREGGEDDNSEPDGIMRSSASFGSNFILSIRTDIRAMLDTSLFSWNFETTSKTNIGSFSVPSTDGGTRRREI